MQAVCPGGQGALRSSNIPWLLHRAQDGRRSFLACLSFTFSIAKVVVGKLDKDPEEPLVIFTASNKKCCGFEE